MIKWRIMLGLGFKEFESAKRTISGIEVVRMIKKNQLVNPESSTYKNSVGQLSKSELNKISNHYYNKTLLNYIYRWLKT